MKVLIPLIVPLLLYGCFGSDDNASTSLSGTVADGYIENATVCFDANGNLSCDDSEPTTTTAADGTYTVTATGSLDGLAVIAVVGPDSKDADDNGQTMAEAGKAGFNFMAPAENPEVVSPLSTLVQFEIISNPDFSLDEAQSVVKETLNIDNDDLNLLEYDFVEAAESGDSFATNIKNVTEVLSSALGDVTSNMENDSAIASLKAGGDAGMKAFQTGIMDMIKETVIPSTVKSDGTLVGDVDNLKAQLKGAFRPGDCGVGDPTCDGAGSLVSGFQTAVTAKKKAVKVAATAGEQTVSDVKALMENGLVIGFPTTDNYYNASDENTEMGEDVGLFVEYHKMGTNGEFFAEKILVESEGSWFDPVESMIGSVEFDDHWTLNPKSGMWAPGDMPYDEGDGGGDHMPIFSKGCMSLPGSFSDKMCFKERDLSGKTIASIMCPDGTSSDDTDDGFCNALDGGSAKFKSGSKGLDLSYSYNFDRYRVYIDPCIFGGSCDDMGFEDDNGPISDINTFKTFYNLEDGIMEYIGNDCNVVFTFNNDKILYADGGSCANKNSISAADGDGVESLNFEIKSIGTSQAKVLITGVPQIYVENNPGDLPVGAKLLFAEVTTNATGIESDTNTSGTGIFDGTFMKAGVSRKMSFDTGEQKIGTYQFLDSITAAMGWDTFPYPTSIYEPPEPFIPGTGGDVEECNIWLGLTDDQRAVETSPDYQCLDYCQSNEGDSTCGDVCALLTDDEDLSSYMCIE